MFVALEPSQLARGEDLAGRRAGAGSPARARATRARRGAIALQAQPAVVRGDEGALDHVSQLAHVARPGVGLERGDVRGRQRPPAALPRSCARAVERKTRREQDHVVAALAQRRQAQREDVQPVVEVLAEAALARRRARGRGWSRRPRGRRPCACASCRRARTRPPAGRGAASPAARAAARRSRRGRSCRRRPARSGPRAAAVAPVNAPRSCPKNSLSISVAGIAAQLTLISGRSRRALALVDRPREQLLARAVSPRISTVASVGATWATP